MHDISEEAAGEWEERRLARLLAVLDDHFKQGTKPDWASLKQEAGPKMSEILIRHWIALRKSRAGS